MVFEQTHLWEINSMRKCLDCDVELRDNNWASYLKKKQFYICNNCSKERSRLYRIKKPWVRKFHNCWNRARIEKMKWEIPNDIGYALISSPCAYCGKIQEQFNGLDRIDSSKGYTIDNVVSCCKYCNFAKNDLTVDEFKEHISEIYKYLIEE